MTTFKKIIGREVLDSRGNPTVEVDVYLDNGFGRAMVPSGASTGKFEALEMRDGDSRFGGKGVKKAIHNINNVIARKLSGMPADRQEDVDLTMIELDGTENKNVLGANAMLGVSLATARARADEKKIPLFKELGRGTRIPVPLMNVINGGKHAGGNLAPQEFMLVPHGFNTFKESLRAGTETYHVLKKLLKEKYGSSATNVGDEGGFAPPIDTCHQALSIMVEAIEQAGYSPIEQISFALDPAAAEFFHDGKYHLDNLVLTPDEMVDYWVGLIDEFPIISLEDPFDEQAFTTFAALKRKVGQKVSIVGDDLTVTNVRRIQKAIDFDAMNYLLLKVNQIGTLTESLKAAELVYSQTWGVVVSHRSGETEDSFIADLAVAIKAQRIKTGAPCRSDRVAKYNQLLRIEELLGEESSFAGNT
jgi:enolase